MSRQRAVVAVAVALLLVTAGCAGAGNDAAPSGGDGGAEMDAGGDAPQEAGSDDARSAEDGSAYAVADRQLIRTGEATIHVESFGDASDEVRSIAASYDGYVSDTEQRSREIGNETWTRGTVRFRVPTESFDDAFADATAVGEVEDSSTNTEDVTDQLVDVEARLTNLRAERDRLRELYEGANETEDVLAVQSELSRVQEEIERLEAQQRQLEDRVAYATITVHIVEDRPEGDSTEPEAWYDTGVAAAFLTSVDGVGTALRAIAVGAAYVAPYLLAFGTPVVVGVVAVAKLVQRRGE
ncbi:DUF4349 domain-containing protein [Haloparvum alkalitolerans]|uniref:DUF4349 domain-containing protein n=1 Tax=Haloparvum alkalitolerans TaxID=1042953 RepID=UPI003CF9B65C